MMPIKAEDVSERMFQLIRGDLDRVELRYDPENDLIPEAPPVTHTDKVLLEAIRFLLARAESLERECRALLSIIDEDAGR